MQIWYHETSAVNFYEGQEGFGTVATRNLQLEKNRDWRISPVTLWEILLTTEAERRKTLIDFCQHLFSRELLPAPDELIVGFIEAGMPREEPRRDLTSASSLAKAWSEIVDDKSRTLIYPEELIRSKGNALKEVTKEIFRVVKDEDVVLSPDLFHAKIDMSISQLVKEAERTMALYSLGEETVFRKVALFYCLLLLCAEVDFDNQATKEFWERLGIQSTQSRVEYVISNLPMLIVRGPFVMMAYMTMCQRQPKYSRGLWFDALHAIYLSYVEVLFSNDEHFQNLRDRINEKRLSQKIQVLSEVELVTVEKDWLGLPTD